MDTSPRLGDGVSGLGDVERPRDIVGVCCASGVSDCVMTKEDATVVGDNRQGSSRKESWMLSGGKKCGILIPLI
jgi:hypothetical protein